MMTMMMIVLYFTQLTVNHSYVVTSIQLNVAIQSSTMTAVTIPAVSLIAQLVKCQLYVESVRVSTMNIIDIV